MAQTASETERQDAAEKLPLGARPALPAIVAVWSAALLGLASLVLSALLELDPGTLLVIALVAATAGASAGLIATRRIAGLSDDETPWSRFTARDQYPDDEEDLIDDTSFAAPVVVKKRRSLIVSNENRSDGCPTVPVPGEDPAGKIVEEDRMEHTKNLSAHADALSTGPAGQIEVPPLDQAEPNEGDVAFETEPLVFNAPSLARNRQETAAPDTEDDLQPAPLEQLGMVQLAERLGRSIEKRRGKSIGSKAAS